MSRTRTLVRGGMLVGTDPALGALPRGDLLVEEGRIVAVAARLDAPGAEVVDARGRIVAPGFVDTHRHTWQTAFRGVGTDWTFRAYGATVHGRIRPHYRPDDVYLGNLLGRLEALNSGVTTLLDWFHCADRPENADAAVQALRDAPGHSVFCYGAGVADEPIADEVRRMRARLPDDGMVLGLRAPQRTPMDTVAADVALARELGLRVSVHVHAAASPPGGDRPVAEMRARGLLDDRTTLVHGNGLSDEEIAMLAGTGCSVSVSPDVELRMGLGRPETGRMLAAGIRPSLSVDTCLTAGGDMFATMRTAFSVERGTGGGLTAQDVLEFATMDGARTLGRGSRTGVLAPAWTPTSSSWTPRTSRCSRSPTPSARSSPPGIPAWWTACSSPDGRSSGTVGCSAWTCRRCAPGCWRPAPASPRPRAYRCTAPGPRVTGAPVR